AFKKELHQYLAEGSVVVFVPGIVHARSGQNLTIPAATVQFLTSAGAPVLPLFVEHPEETALSVENRGEIERIVLSFGEPLQREAATLANFTENLLIAAETAFAARPILRSHLAWEILRGLKKHGRSAEIID